MTTPGALCAPPGPEVTPPILPASVSLPQHKDHHSTRFAGSEYDNALKTTGQHLPITAI